MFPLQDFANAKEGDSVGPVVYGLAGNADERNAPVPNHQRESNISFNILFLIITTFSYH